MYSRWTVHKSSFCYWSCFCLTPCQISRRRYQRNTTTTTATPFFKLLFLASSAGRRRENIHADWNFSAKQPAGSSGLIGSSQLLGSTYLPPPPPILAAPLHLHRLQPNTTRVVSNHGFRSHYAYDCLEFQYADLDESDHWSGLEEAVVVMSKRCSL